LSDVIISLISTISGTNDMGDPIKIPHIRENIFASKKSITRVEFYQAAAAGIKPQITFEMRTIDYEDELLLGYENKTYKLIRTFEKDNDFIELICEGGVNNVPS